MNRKYIYLIITLSFLAAISLVYFYKDLISVADAPTINKELSETEDSNNYNNGTSTDKKREIEIAPGIIAEIIDDEVSSTTPIILDLSVLDKEAVIPEGLIKEVADRRLSDIKASVEKIKKDNYDFDSWINLGIYYKAIDDFNSTKICWENASLIRPGSALPLSNLGGLYGYYLKDKEAAEKYFLRSLEVEPNVGFWYYQAFSFYREVMSDEAKARSVLEKGVKNNPGDAELKNILDSLK